MGSTNTCSGEHIMDNFFLKELYDSDGGEKYKENEIREIVEKQKHWIGYSNEIGQGYCHIYEIFKNENNQYSI